MCGLGLELGDLGEVPPKRDCAPAPPPMATLPHCATQLPSAPEAPSAPDVCPPLPVVAQLPLALPSQPALQCMSGMWFPSLALTGHSPTPHGIPCPLPLPIRWQWVQGVLRPASSPISQVVTWLETCGPQMQEVTECGSESGINRMVGDPGSGGAAHGKAGLLTTSSCPLTSLQIFRDLSQGPAEDIFLTELKVDVQDSRLLKGERPSPTSHGGGLSSPSSPFPESPPASHLR